MEYITGLKGLEQLKQLCSIYDSISSETVLRLLKEEEDKGEYNEIL
jgi:hypothetical protein